MLLTIQSPMLIPLASCEVRSITPDDLKTILTTLVEAVLLEGWYLIASSRLYRVAEGVQNTQLCCRVLQKVLGSYNWVGPWYIFYFLGGCWFGGGFLISSLVICFCDGVALLVVVVFRVRAS